jgi:hypothetical protein
MNAIEKDDEILLGDGQVFPVEAAHSRQGGLLLIRKAQRDLWNIFEDHIAKGGNHMLVLGPPGAGKVFSFLFKIYNI